LVRRGVMSMTVQTVREEHDQFVPYLESVRAIADSIGTISEESVLAHSSEIHEFLAHRLLPHAVAEGTLLFPMVRELTGGPEPPPA
jgi:iron-sulfur cluster repair protein YtfE (RIC family)